jgi:hypothetical protein
MPYRSVVVLTLFLFSAAPVAAQGIRGVVRDGETQEPISHASVLLTDAAGVTRTAVMSDLRGNFYVPVTLGATVHLQVQRLGYTTVESGMITIDRADTLVIDVWMRPQPVTLPEVTATTRWRNRNRAEFERRRGREIWGRFVTPDRLEEFRVSQSNLLLAAVLPSVVPDERGSIIQHSRGVRCTPTVFVDGWQLPHGAPIEVHADAIRAIEHYAQPGHAPVEFRPRPEILETTRSGAPRFGRPNCGIVVIWTDHGFGELAQPTR